MWYSSFYEWIKKNRKPKKAPVFPYQYDKIEKSLIKNWTSKDKVYKANSIIILNKKSNICSIDVDKADKCPMLNDWWMFQIMI